MTTTSKVPEATLVFWITKILATTLGETGGDAVTMSMHAGYLLGSAIFGVLFLAAVAAQISASAFRPSLYWLAMVGATTVGTTLADFADRSLGIGYPGGASLLFALLMASFYAWHRATGSLQLGSVSSGKSEFFYWLTIMCSQTLGTALGDWTADSLGLGYAGGALVFGTLLLALWLLLYRWTTLSRIALFWAAFVLTRPLGAVLGDLLDKPVDHGGLALSRYVASLALLAVMAGMVALVRQRPARSIAHG
ncbi:hypothetical protein FNZ56_00825 [Pseudoluteimonas lycopersici]|uniref:Membrane-anchored protein n=1 Tax=Pseudoluteimonas lycopersici TaxID=1324796 RepID=A0A516V854_9GAMM|nr:hypothetical protein [Lysobacter lycopersici]QDQ74706.1 hypothetical protein FNZ56_00825 [Lysobacter lycopersici]